MLIKSEIPGYSTTRTHRTYTAQFKAELVAACGQPGVSIAALAGQHAMNANELHRWLKEHQRSGRHQLAAHSPAAALEMTSPSCRVYPAAAVFGRAAARTPGDQGRAAPGRVVDGRDLAGQRGSRVCELGGCAS